MFYLVILVFIVCFKNILAMNSSKALEGYPAGYLPDCPGSTIPVLFEPKLLHLLSVSVQQEPNIFAIRNTYTYYQMDQLVQDPDLDFRRPTVMYVGGYMDHPDFIPGLFLGAMYKKLGYNVLLLNTNAFTVAEYPVASRNIRTVGKHAAEILAYLTNNGMDPKTLSLVGLSLGSHTASFIGKNYKILTGSNVSRITGLDPSGPCFRNLGPEDRLDQSDADFVDIIETNIDGYGMAAPVGHVNFYVNGGEFQPGDFIWVPCNTFCSHIRSLTLWVAALNHPNDFIAMKCDSVQEARDRNCFDKTPLITNVVGLRTDVNKQGVFYLGTDNTYPYFLREKGLDRKYDFFSTHLSLDRKVSNDSKIVADSNNLIDVLIRNFIKT